MENMKKLIRTKSIRGMTLIEIMIAVAILAGALIGTASVVSVGLVQLNNIRVQRAAANCARMVLEYLEALPPDVIYNMSPGAAITGDFASGAGIPGLNSFVNSNGDTSCYDLSNTATGIGAQVKLQYMVCPGCYTYSYLEPASLLEWTQCYYIIKAGVSFNGLVLGAPRKIIYEKKRYHGTVDTCENACGTGTLGEPGDLVNCVY